MGKLGWEESQKETEKHSSTGKFCRLEGDGESVIVGFLGDPYSREVVWNEAENRYDEAPAGEKSSLRVSINVYNVALKKVQIFEGGVTWFRQVLNVREKYGLSNWYFEIKRQGAKNNPKTTYTILPDNKIDDAGKKDLAAFELYDLSTEVVKDESSTPTKTGGEKKSKASKGNGADRLIDPDVSSSLVSQLKELPNAKEVVKDFLKKFGVDRIRDIPFVRQGEASADVESLVKAATKPAEVDPFA